MAETINNKYHKGATQYDYTNSTLNASNIQFLSGSQAQLNKYLLESGDSLSGKAKEGAFYLTTDTHRLYIGRAITVSGSTKIIPVPVNEGIETVTSVSNLPSSANQGEFYYISDANILAVRSGNAWVQLNTDTNIGKVESFVSPSLNASGKGSVAVQTTITDSAGGVFGTAYDEKWELIPGDNVTFEYTAADTSNQTPARLTIKAIDTTYTLGTTSSTSANGGKIKITPTGTGSATTVTLQTASGDSDLAISSDANGNVTFDLKELDGVDVKAKTYNSSNASTTTGFDIVPVVDGVVRTFSGNNTTFSGHLDPAIAYGSSVLGLNTNETLPNSGGQTTVKFQNGTATLDVYSRLQTEKRIEDVVNSKIQIADALTYKGTASYSTGSWVYSPSTSTFKKGDVYKVTDVGSGVSIDGTAVQVGDLLIANGTEGSNGIITSNSLTWDLIPSGNEPTYVGAIDTTNNNFTIEEKLNGVSQGNILKVTYDASPSNWLNVSTSADGTTAGDGLTVTYTHNGSDSATLPNFSQAANQDNTLTYTNAPAGDTISFLALNTTTPLTISKGHVTAINGKKVTISLNKLNSLYTTATTYTSSELTSGGVSSAAKLNLFADDVKGNSSYLTNKEIRYTSNTLNITGATTGSGANSYGTINVDLKWGTF